MVAVTNGIGVEYHELIQESVNNRYPVTISLSFARGSTPVSALSEATEVLQQAGSAQDESRRRVLRGDTSEGDGDIHIAHFDVNDATEEYTDRLNAFDSMIRIKEGYMELMRYMRDTHDSLCFFVGGDNIIAACPALDETAYEDSIDHIADAIGVELKAGVGQGETAEEAGMAAKRALDRCRETDKSVVGP